MNYFNEFLGKGPSDSNKDLFLLNFGTVLKTTIIKVQVNQSFSMRSKSRNQYNLSKNLLVS